MINDERRNGVYAAAIERAMARRCMLTVSKPVLKAPMVSTLEATI
jgi:hypothetical protein